MFTYIFLRSPNWLLIIKLVYQSKLTLTPVNYMTTLITLNVIFELSLVPRFSPVKDIVKTHPRRCSSPSSSSNNIETFCKVITPKALLAVRKSCEDFTCIKGDSQEAGNAFTARSSTSTRCLGQRGPGGPWWNSTPRIPLQASTTRSDLQKSRYIYKKRMCGTLTAYFL